VANEVKRICVVCGHEFVISKFQPYIKQCKEHRSKLGYVVKTKKKEVKDCCVEAMHKAEIKHKSLVVCSCQAQFWQSQPGSFRDFFSSEDGTYRFYAKGRMVGRASSIRKGLEMLENHGFNHPEEGWRL